VERGLDPMKTNLVVADPDRSDKTICLAVSPSMKALGVKNRCRVFEIPPNIDYIMAQPRMQKYVDYAAEIYGTYLRYISPDDIYVYSIDEAFLDVTDYLHLYKTDGKGMAIMLMNKVWEEVGVRATAGVGTNLYLTKIALDITAKHAADFIGILDEETYRKTLWDHRPLTDFWRIGPGTARRLARSGIFTQGAIAHTDEDFLYDTFGIDAELMIDHAWGREPVTLEDIKAYRPKNNSISSGQVLMRDYNFDEGRIIVKEMADSVCTSLVARGMVARSFGLMAGYSASQHAAPDTGGFTLDQPTNAASIIVPKFLKVYENIADRDLKLRRFNLTAAGMTKDTGPRQLSFFDQMAEGEALREENQLQKTVISIREKYGKSAMFKGLDLQKGATTIERAHQIGGHRSGDDEGKRKR